MLIIQMPVALSIPKSAWMTVRTGDTMPTYRPPISKPTRYVASTAPSLSPFFAIGGIFRLWHEFVKTHGWGQSPTMHPEPIRCILMRLEQPVFDLGDRHLRAVPDGLSGSGLREEHAQTRNRRAPERLRIADELRLTRVVDGICHRHARLEE